MRPLELELANFRSYERESVDWRGHDLVVIAGDTGAGKTSLLDAICFALYGRTPELTGPGELLTIGRENGEVRLTVQIASETWRVTRRFGKRAPQPQHLLERLDEDGGDVVETIVGKDPVDRRARDLVGLTYEAFTSTVLLAQGQFARFFASRGADRDDILRELFSVQSMEAVRATALQMEAGHAARAATLASEASLADIEARTLTAVAKATRDSAARLGALRLLTPRHAAWTRRRDEEFALDRDRQALHRATRHMPTPSQRSQAAASDATARATLAGQTSERERMRAARAEAAAALADGEARLGKTSELAALRSSAERYDALAADVPARRAGLATAHSALKDRVDQLTRLEQEIAGQQLAHDSLVAQAGAAASLDSARAHLDQAATAMVEALRRRDIAMDSVRAADAHLLATRALHEQSIQAAQAAHLRSGLHPGDDCPICGGPIGFLPGLGAPENDTTTALRVAEADAMDAHRELAARQAELSGSEGRRAEAETAAEAARSALPTGDLKSRASAIDLEAQASKLADEMRTTGTRVQSEREAVTREAGRIHEIAAQVERDTREIDQLAAALEQHGGRDRVGTIVSSLAELAGLAERVNEADRELLAVESSVAEAERLVSGVEATLIRPLRLAAAAAAQSADLIPPGSDLSAEALDAACEALDRRLVERAAALEVEFTDLRQQSATELVWLTEQTAAAGLAGPEDIPRATERAKTDHVTAQSDLARAVERAMQSRRRLRDAAEARAQAERFRVVALDLRADRFPRFLLQRYRERLAVAASERLQDLSRGAYRFAAAEPDPLAIVDTRRGEATRSVATLSGGERFLASLSLALALGDIAAGAGGRLDCLFLDEGFSTLDADSLELAIAGIERLSGGGRLIGVITHLPGVAERLGAAIRVVKDPTGVSRVMRDALAA